ncbi:hypothetical protein ROR02_16710 [Pararhodospirillum oryzae]|uniref:protein O-GlcNAc transferase n=1 Tax=Pararhodospirillum oryzae TaxID=478448 RepID=A0A512H818_9PROT|nr:hypothetical protein ROR02_16710 [Pararhodospirillum oryzae]
MYRACLDLDPEYPNALNNLAVVFKETGRLDEAITCYERALARTTEPVAVYNNLSLAYFQARNPTRAQQVCREALALFPSATDSWFNLGNAFVARMDRRTGARYLTRAARLSPDYFPALVNLADALKGQGLGEEAIQAARRAAEVRPGALEPYVNWADALREHGRITEAIPVYAQALANQPTHAPAHSNLLLSLNYADGRSGLENLKAHRYWGQVHADPLTPDAPGHANIPDPDRVLRIGFVSADFRTHSVGYFLRPILESLDPSLFQIYCYSTGTNDDSITEYFKRAASVWRPVARHSDEQLAALILEDRIDILVDVAGHTGGNRLLTFARKPAPVQVSWLGYPNTTGIKAMDYRLTDAVADPYGMTDDFHTEALVRLPSGFLCYQPVSEIPTEVNALPALEKGFVTFGSFNNLSKVTPAVTALWAEVLNTVPNSKLLLKGLVFADPQTRQFYTDLFTQHGVDPDRLILLSRIDAADGHFRAYHQVDIGLDPFPYNGTTTTCEALWMGVPVVTLLGTIHAGRVGASLLHQVGLGHLIARDRDAYVALCAGLARDLPALAVLRRTMRARLNASPLRDEAGQARAMGVAFRDMWRAWCRGRTEATTSPPS